MKTILPLLFVLWSSISFSQINLKNLQGQTVAFFDELKKYPSDAPVLVFTWANEYCPPCEKILDALKTDYATLNNDYGLRIMTINVDHGDGFIEHYNDVHKSSLGNYTTTYGFVRKYKDKKGWNFDHYADDNESFITAIEATGTPTAFIFLNDQVEFRLDGFTVPEHKKGANLNDPEIIKATKQTYMDVISSFYAYERYFSQKWMYSTKEDATYRRSIVKVGDMYEITDSWVSGEIQMRGMSTDILAINKVGSYKFYHKNGKIETEITYVNGKKNGIEKKYYESGKLKNQYTWVDDVKNGACSETDEDGATFTGAFKNDKFDGTWSATYANGKQKAENLWENGLLKEIKYYNDPNGNPLDKGTLSNGSGTRKMYNNKGKLTAIFTYEAGKFISEYRVEN